jgi:hypothetical protein
VYIPFAGVVRSRSLKRITVDWPGSVAPSVVTGVVIGVGDLLLVQEHPVGLSCQRLPMKLPQKVISRWLCR